jgi:hypothetical protein
VNRIITEFCVLVVSWRFPRFRAAQHEELFYPYVRNLHERQTTFWPPLSQGRRQFCWEEKTMSEKRNNIEMSEAGSTADENKTLSEDARGLRPRQAGPFRIGVVDMIVGEGGAEVPAFVATKKRDPPVGVVFGD